MLSRFQKLTILAKYTMADLYVLMLFFLTRHENKLKSALIFNLIFSQGPQWLDFLWSEGNVNLADTFQAYSEGTGDAIKRFGVSL